MCVFDLHTSKGNSGRSLGNVYLQLESCLRCQDKFETALVLTSSIFVENGDSTTNFIVFFLNRRSDSKINVLIWLNTKY